MTPVMKKVMDMYSIALEDDHGFSSIWDLLPVLQSVWAEKANLNIKLETIDSCPSQVWEYASDQTVICKKLMRNKKWKMRQYQNAAVESVVGENVAVSGTIKLPCGAGKTLILSEVVAELETTGLILTTNNISCNQWKSHFHSFYEVEDDEVVIIKPEMTFPTHRWFHSPPAITIMTYSMLTTAGQHCESLENVMKLIQSIVFGVVVCDEAQNDSCCHIPNIYKFATQDTYWCISHLHERRRWHQSFRRYIRSKTL